MNPRTRNAACIAVLAFAFALVARSLKRNHDRFADCPASVDPAHVHEQRGETLSTPADPYENRPTAVVYDIFTETSGRLIGRYTHLSDRAQDSADRERWWRKAMEVRTAKRAVPAHDRDQLIAHIQQWTAEVEALESEE
ncbi:hypothetical protein [Streptomyces sp. NPDC012746]|uniref:hypothetical protein n=1 Tax=Streptomyces sp. NPDC012746 TaxID=3364845 RepID=UPI0036B18235